MKRYQRGYVQGIGKAMAAMFVAVGIAGLVGGVLIWEGLQWVASHLSISWN